MVCLAKRKNQPIDCNRSADFLSSMIPLGKNGHDPNKTGFYASCDSHSGMQIFAGTNYMGADFRDLPEGECYAYGNTTLQYDGARHSEGSIWLGESINTEPDGLPGWDALDDSSDNGVFVPGSVIDWDNGSSADNQLTIEYTVPSGESAYIVGWIDFNNDNDFGDPGEMVISTDVDGSTGMQFQNFTIDVPANTFCADSGCTGSESNADRVLYARFRIFTEEPILASLAYSGFSTNGEVEDYRFLFSPTAVSLAGFSANTSEFPWWAISLAAFLLIGAGMMALRTHWQKVVIRNCRDND